MDAICADFWLFCGEARDTRALLAWLRHHRRDLCDDATSCRRGSRALLMRGVPLVVLLLGGFSGSALAAIETSFSGPATSPNLTSIPLPLPPLGKVQTSFTTYSGRATYVLFPFTVAASGSYTAKAIASNSSVTYFLTGLFSPSYPTAPTTPISNFFAGNLQYSDIYYSFPSLSLTNGTQYSLLIVFNVPTVKPTDKFTFSMTGPGCMDVPSITTCSSNITAPNTYPASGLGKTVNPVFQGGTLQVDVPGQTYNQNFTLSGAGTNTIDQAGKTATFSGVFSDAVAGTPGSITIANSGSGGAIAFTGVNTYTGMTTIGSGATLDLLGGSLASPVSVDGGGTLRGSGSIGGAVSVASGGTLAVGASPGLLTVGAPVTLAPGAALSFDIDGPTPGTGAGHYSMLMITGSGNALNASGTLVPVLRGLTGSATNSYTPPIGQQFLVAVAQGGVTGSFSGLTQPSSALPPGTRVDALYGPSSLSLVITPASYGNLALAGLAETANETAVGRALDAIRPPAGVRMPSGPAALFDPLYTLPGQAIAPALAQLAPTIYGDGVMAARQIWYAMADAVTEQMAARRGGINAAQTADGPHGSTIWMSGIGQFFDVSSSAGAPAYNASMGGGIVGIDIPLKPGVMVGAAVGGASTQTSSAGATDNGTAVQFSVYGGLQSANLFLDGQVAYTHVDQNVRRSVGFSNITGNGGLNGGGAQVLGGLHLPYGRWRIEPAVGFSVLSLDPGSMTETVGGSPAERIDGQSITSVQSLVGVRIGTQFAITPAVPMSVHALVGWDHEYADVTARTTAAFAFAAALPFSVSSAPIARDAARLGGGFDVNLTPAVSLFGTYQAELGRVSTAQNLTGGIRVIW